MNSKISILFLSYLICGTFAASTKKNELLRQNELRVLFNFTSEADFTDDDINSWEEASDTLR